MFTLFFTFVIILIFTAHIRTTSSSSHESNEEVIWPEGNYGLPKAKSGCPKTEQFVWDQGLRLQNLEDNLEHHHVNEASKLSTSLHMEVSLFKQLLVRTFCIKKQHDEIQIERTSRWPQGSYCIYQYGDNCPSGMVNGSIKWDDRNVPNQKNHNQKLGTLPKGLYTFDTVIFYCCQNQSTWNDVIELPISSPFYLLPYKPRSQANPRCQRVKWALATMEYIRFDTEDDNNKDMFHGHHVFTDERKGLPTVNYCYYESCRYKEETRGIFNSSGQSLVPAFPSYQSCSWLITVEESMVVSLNLTSLYISDCNDNFLMIYDGSSEASPRIATYCGFTTPTDVNVFSSGRNIYMVLKSGNLSKHMNYSFGFEARYGPKKIIPSPHRSQHYVEAIGLSCFALILTLVVLAIIIGYRRRSKNEIKEKEPTSRFHIPSTIVLETKELQERVPSCKETRNPYYVTAKLWDDSSLSRSSDNVAYVTSPELNHGYMDASGADPV